MAKKKSARLRILAIYTVLVERFGRGGSTDHAALKTIAIEIFLDEQMQGRPFTDEEIAETE